MGSLFLTAFVAYLSGSALVATAAAADHHNGRLAAGAVLMLLNSAVVASIGVLALPVLRRHDGAAAYVYLVARVVEAVLLAVGVVLVLAQVAPVGNDDAYQTGMIALAIGGVVFCRVLWRARLVPRLLAGWGLVGYAVFGLGAVLELAGVPVGLVLSVPGGLFEVALAVVLIARGFGPTPAAPVPAEPAAPTLVAR